MKEQPNIADIAGRCNEPTAWHLFLEISDDLLEHGPDAVDPYRIIINNDGHFSLLRTSMGHYDSFDAPEIGVGQPNETNEANAAWSLGATAFFVVMGRQVMNDRGSKGQKASSKLPYMRNTWPALSELVQRCLDFIPENRPSLQDIHKLSEKECNRCDDDIRRGPKFKESPSTVTSKLHTDTEPSFWPETMKNPETYTL